VSRLRFNEFVLVETGNVERPSGQQQPFASIIPERPLQGPIQPFKRLILRIQLLMSAFTQSSRSDQRKFKETTGCFRPEAAVDGALRREFFSGTGMCAWTSNQTDSPTLFSQL
jgi:hypothetical protein